MRMNEVMRRLIGLDISEDLTKVAKEWLANEIDNGSSDISPEKIRAAVEGLRASHIEKSENPQEAAQLVERLMEDF